MDLFLNEMRTHVRCCYKAFLGILLVSFATTSSATSLFYTDSSWKVTALTPATVGWSDSTAFDDSGWQSATILYDVGSAKGGVPGYSAQGIWSSGGQFSQTETTIWARGIFNLSALPISASLINGFDDDGDIYINGTQVVSDHNGYANDSSAPDILSYLHLGENLVAFTASDNYPVWGYNHAAWVQIDGEIPSPSAVPLPAALPLMLSGLGVLGFASRRRKEAV